MEIFRWHFGHVYPTPGCNGKQPARAVTRILNKLKSATWKFQTIYLMQDNYCYDIRPLHPYKTNIFQRSLWQRLLGHKTRNIETIIDIVLGT